MTSTQAAGTTHAMTAAGWILMLSSVGFVLWLTAYCFYRVLTAPPRDATNRSDPESDA